ncbi:MAG: acyl-CoA dehydratase activase-related protein [Coriobacteriales bacterium]|jgi:predicted CoA-substrate-specific enzyme activase|nr:acyl-CoA dehydratase activase-related protein [Coriobacteriales bacterium]
MDTALYHLGIDAGSKTIKLVLLDESKTPVFSHYRLHRSDIISTVRELLRDTIWRIGDRQCNVCVTGSAGIRLAELWQVPHLQEVVACRQALATLIPEADVAIELGGEDAKIIYLKGGVEQRMNGSCAGGTGGFIDLMTNMLGVRAREFNALALRHQTIYPIASRCAVFAQNDVRPLLNEGARKSDIAASILQAVVTQTIAGLACGRPIQGKVAFLGGPFEVYSELVSRFRQTLGLSHAQTIKPKDAQLFVAQGAALWAAQQASCQGACQQDCQTNQQITSARGKDDRGQRVLRDQTDGQVAPPLDRGKRVLRNQTDGQVAPPRSLQALLAQAEQTSVHVAADIARLVPLFTNSAQQEAFKQRHAQNHVQRARLTDVSDSVFLGIDAGSTTVKLALINAQGQLLYSAYENTRGDLLATARSLLVELHLRLPREYGGDPLVEIGRVVVTGYGEQLLLAALNADAGVVETVAHLRAAREFCPDVDFLLDIGGQDIKCMRVRGGAIDDLMLNEACSSGCGALIEGFSRSLGYTRYNFSDSALQATLPVDLGTRCTVFMTSRVRHAQKEGASVADIAAGLAYSVARNALYKVIGCTHPQTLGKHVVVQGGTFKSDAVLRAFELQSGLEVVRPDIAELMGAFGAALLARDEYLSLTASDNGTVQGAWADVASDDGTVQSEWTGNRAGRVAGCGENDSQSAVGEETGCEQYHDTVKSGLLMALELESLQHSQSTRYCSACANNCLLTESVFKSRISNPKAGSHQGWKFGRSLGVTADVTAPGSAATSDEAGEGWQVRRLISGNRCARAGSLAKQTSLAKPTVARSNLFAGERRLLAAYQQNTTLVDIEPTDTTPLATAPVDTTPIIGIPGVLHCVENYPFWYSFFTHLGMRVITVFKSSAQIYAQGAACVTSEGMCYPAKLAHGHVVSLIEQGAQWIFMPEGGAVAQAGSVSATGQFGRHAAVSHPGNGTPAVHPGDDAPAAHLANDAFVARNTADLSSACFADSGVEALPQDGTPTACLECPVARGAARLVAEQLCQQQGKTGFLSCDVSSDEPLASQLFNTLKAQGLAARLGLNRARVAKALCRARAEQERFYSALACSTQSALDELQQSGGKGIVLAAHPYFLDTGLSHGIDTMLASMGYTVLSASGLLAWERKEGNGQPSVAKTCSEQPTYQGDLASVSPVKPAALVAESWVQAHALYQTARIVCAHPQLELLQLHAFGCGVDAMSTQEVRSLIESSGKLYTAIKLDAMVDIAAIRLRLRSLRAALDSRSAKDKDTGALAFSQKQDTGARLTTIAKTDANAPLHGQKGLSNICVAPAGTSGTTTGASAPRVIMPALAPKRLEQVAALMQKAGYQLEILEDITPADIDVALSHCNHDLCYPLLAVAGQLILTLGATPQKGIPLTVLIPQVCCGCRGLELERIVRHHCRATDIGGLLTICGIPSQDSGLVMDAQSAQGIYEALNAGAQQQIVPYRPPAHDASFPLPASQCAPRPAVGLIANAALLYTPYLNQNILEQIYAAGLCPYVPRLTELLTTGAPLEKLADAFVSQGINHLICLQSFGCLHGHIHARGAAAALKRRHPQLHISFIDYDPGASRINQDSRLKLALSVAKDSACLTG